MALMLKAVAEADDRGLAVGVLGRAVQGFDQDAARRPTQRDDLPEQVIDQLVRELAHEVALPVVPVLFIRRVEHVLLLDERLVAEAVVHEPGAERRARSLRNRRPSRGTAQSPGSAPSPHPQRAPPGS